MPTKNCEILREEFRTRSAEILRFFLVAPSLHIKLGKSRFRPIPSNTLDSIVESCLIQLAVEWELFVQETYLGYLCGKRRINGEQPRATQPIFSDRSKAYDYSCDGNTYPSWARNSVLKKATKDFDDGEPFSTSLKSNAQLLDDIVSVRNRAVHISEHSEEKFRQVVRNRMGYFPIGFTPGRFLRTISAPRLPMKSVFESYCDGLGAIARALI